MLEIRNEYGRVPLSNAYLRRVFSAVCGAERTPKASATLLIVSDRAIRELNKRYRGKDAVTDILSFAAGEGEGVPGHDSAYVGEVILSYPQIVRQAKLYGNASRYEFTMLFVHGLLHLFGYDHEADRDYERMHAREKHILTNLGYAPS